MIDPAGRLEDPFEAGAHRFVVGDVEFEQLDGDVGVGGHVAELVGLLDRANRTDHPVRLLREVDRRGSADPGVRPGDDAHGMFSDGVLIARHLAERTRLRHFAIDAWMSRTQSSASRHLASACSRVVSACSSAVGYEPRNLTPPCFAWSARIVSASNSSDT